MKNKLATIGLSMGLMLTQATLVLAADDITVKQPGQVSVSQIGQLISAFVGMAIIIAALLAFIYLVWGGIEWITSGGDKAGMENARNRITNALIGLVIVVAAWAITVLIGKFFNIDIFNIKIPTVKDFQ